MFIQNEILTLACMIVESGIIYIGDGTLLFYDHIVNVTLPDGLEPIGDNAFQECSSLTSINIPDNVTSIGAGAFYECASLRLVTYCGTKTDIHCGSNWLISGTRIVVPSDYSLNTFCGRTVTKYHHACSGCPTCANSASSDIFNDTSYSCSSCDLGYGLFGGACDKCGDSYYSEESQCKECDKSCATCSGISTNCSTCHIGYEFYNNSCTDCSDGYYKMGNECRDLSTASVFSVELVDGTDVTPDLIDTVRDGISDILWCEDCVYVKDNGNGGLDIYLFDNDVSDAKDKLDRCLKDSNCRQKFSMIKPINNDPSYGISHRLCIIALFIFIIALFY